MGHARVLIVSFVLAALTPHVRPLNLTVFYETLCPFSKQFIARTLYPMHQVFSPYVNIELVPYGNALITTTPSWSMRCQHGRKECYGNTVQACFMAEYPTTELTLQFVKCFMTSPNVPYSGPQCAKDMGLNYTAVEQCASGPAGRTLMTNHALRTKAFRPKVTMVPTIAINNKFNQGLQNRRSTDLPRYICQKLRFEPDVCSHVVLEEARRNRRQ